MRAVLNLSFVPGKTNNTLHINKKGNEKGDIQRVDFIDQ